MSYPSGHTNPYVAATTRILQEWFLAMQDRTTEWRMPDPRKPIWEEERVNRLIEELDTYYDQQVANWAGLPTGSVYAAAGPDFWRLPPQARFAMCQELQDVIDGYAGTDHEEEVLNPHSEWFDRWLASLNYDVDEALEAATRARADSEVWDEPLC